MLVPDQVALQFVLGRCPVRVCCKINEFSQLQCAIRPKGDGGFYINVGTSIRRQGKLVVGQRLSVQVWKDDSEFGRDMPEELAELLKMDLEGEALFSKILPSQQRGIIHYIDSAKSVQVRVDRAIKMIKRLKGMS